VFKKEPYTKGTQPMARDPTLTRHLPIPHIGGQDGRSRWSATSTATPTQMKLKNEFRNGPAKGSPILLTYSKMPITSLTDEPIPIQSDTSLPSVLSPDQSLTAETNTFSKEDTFHLACINESAFGGELGSMNLQLILQCIKHFIL